MEDIFSLLRKRIGEDTEVLINALKDNRVSDIENYRHITGQLRGLTTALHHIKDLEANQETDWDD